MSILTNVQDLYFFQLLAKLISLWLSVAQSDESNRRNIIIGTKFRMNIEIVFSME